MSSAASRTNSAVTRRSGSSLEGQRQCKFFGHKYFGRSVANVVDVMALQPLSEHPHGLEDQDFDELFTTDKPVIFAFHGYPAMIHKLTYRRHNHDNIHVRGYQEEGTTTTPFDMVVLNNLDRYQLALDAIQTDSTAQRSSGEGDGALLDDDGASQALYQRAWRRHAGGPRLALDLVSTMFRLDCCMTDAEPS